MSASSSPDSTASLESPPAAPALTVRSWPFGKRFALCSAFVFFVFANWPFPFGFITYAYTIAMDEKKQTVTWTGRDDPKRKFTLAFTRPDPNTLVLDGIIAGRALHATCHRMGETGNLLLTRGFHWVNEYPFNR